MPLAYRQVKNIYDALHDAGVTQESLPEWAARRNAESETDRYSAGLHDNWIKRSSVALDRLIERTGAPEATAPIGEALGALVGAPEAGERIGRGLPRMAATFLPLAIPGPGWVTAAGLGAAGAIGGAETYTATGSPAAGALSALTNIALPGIAGAAERAALRGVGAPLVEGSLANVAGEVTGGVSKFFPSTSQDVLAKLAGQGAAAGVMQASEFGQQAIAGEPLSVHPTEMLLNMTLGQLPFAAAHLGGRAIKGRVEGPKQVELQARVDASAKFIELRKAKDELERQAPVSSLPDVEREALTPERHAEITSLIAKSRGQQVDVENDPTLSPEEKFTRLNSLLQTEADALKEQQQPIEGPKTVMGDQVDAGDRTQMVGKQLKETKGARIVFIEDLPVNPPELRGKVVTYSKGTKEKPPEVRSDGNTVFDVSAPQWRTPKTLEEWNGRFAKVENPLQPELPVQDKPATNEEITSHISELEKVKVEAENAKTAANLQTAIVRLQNVQEEAGMTPTTDHQIKEMVKKIEESGLVAPENVIPMAIKRLASQAKRIIQEQAKVPETPRDVPPPPTAEEIATVSAKMEGGGFSVIVPSKKSNTTELTKAAGPFGNIVEEAAHIVTAPHVKTQPEDVQMFRTIVSEVGSLKDIGPEEIDGIAQVIAERDKVSVAEATVDVKDFLERPQAKKWADDLEFELQQRRDGNAEPGVSDSPERIAEQLGLKYDGPSLGGKAMQFTNLEAGKETSQDVPVGSSMADVAKAFGKPVDEVRAPGGDRIFLPETPEDIATVKAIGNTGQSLHQWLQTSKNPYIVALMKDLAKFTDALGRIDVTFKQTAHGGSKAVDTGNGRVLISIGHGRLRNSDLDFSGAHELVHGLTLVELNRPRNIRFQNELDGMRERLIEALPSQERKAVKNAIHNELISKYVRGEVAYRDVFPGIPAAKQQVLYGLANLKEFVAQGLSSHEMQGYMRSVKSEGGSWFSRFTNTIKQVLGIGSKIPDTVWHEFLSKTDQLLDKGNFVSSLADFTDRHFENLGLSDAVKDSQTQRALGLVEGPKSTFGILHDLLQEPDFQNPYARDVIRMVFTKGDGSVEHAGVMDESGFAPTLDGLRNFVHDAVQGLVENPTDAIDMLPKTSQDYVFDKLTSTKQVLDAVSAATAERNKGLINLADPEALRSPVAEATRLVDKLLSAQEEWKQSELNVHRMQAIGPDGFVSAHTALEPEAFGDPEPFMRETLKKPKGGFARFFTPSAQIARSNPSSAEIIDRGYQLEPAARQYRSALFKVLGMDLGTGDVTPESLKLAIKTVETPKTLKAVDRWTALNQTLARNEKHGVVVYDIAHPEVQKLLGGLSDTEKAGVFDMVKRMSAMTQVGQLSALNYMAKIASARAAVIAVKDQGIKASQAIPLADQAFRALIVDPTDQQAMQVADAQLREVQSKMSTDGFIDMLRYLQTEAQKYKLWENHFKENPAWASAQRQEKYLVSFNRGGKHYQLQASSTKEANKIATGGTGLVIEENFKGRPDEFPVLGPDAPAMMARLQELQANKIRAMESSGKFSQEQLDLEKKYDPVAQFGREAAATGGGIPGFKPEPRLLSQGAEELPWLWNHISWGQRQSNYWTRQLYRAQADLHLSEPELQSNPALAKWMKQHVDNMLQPDPQLTQKVNRFTSTWFMGFAPASALVNGLQTLSTLVPELTSITGRPIDSYRRWKSALFEVGAQYSRGGGKLWKNAEVDALMRAAEKAGERDYSMWDETAQTHEQVSTNFKRMMMKNKTQNLGQRLDTAAGSWSTAAMWMFKTVEKFNHDVTLISAYKLHRDQGFSVEESTQKAFEINRAVNYGGGRAGRPTGLYSGKDAFTRSAAMLATNMQNYNLGVISQLSRYLQSGFFRPGSLKPSEVYAARRAATQMLGTQLAAAGLLGLPFVSGMVALLNQMFPTLEINKKLRESVAAFFSSDKENDNTLQDAALTGLPSMMGWDMQSRLSMGNVTPGVSEYNGFQPELLLGPPANLVGGFVKGALKAVQGEPIAATAFIPPGLKKLTMMLAGDGTIKDYKDRPLFQPTLGEKAGIALGFNPKRLSDLNAASRMSDQTQQLANRREGQWRQTQAEEALKGNFGSIRQTLLERMQTDKDFDVRQTVQSIAQAAEDLTFPRDLRREGSKSTAPVRTKLLSAFNIPPSTPTEVARLQFRQQIQQRLGLPSTNVGSETRVAVLMDQLRQQNPDALRSDLRRQAERLLHGSRRTVSLLPESQ